jgi:hypothetical protein
MARHKRRSVGLFVRRKTYLSLWKQYRELSTAYHALEADHQGVLDDHEELLFEAEAPAPLEMAEVRHVPSWAETEEIPLITTVGLDPDKADALSRNTGLFDQPGGAWGGAGAGSNG